MSLMRSWWFYLGLFALTVILYAGGLRDRAALSELKPMQSAATELTRMPEVDVARVLALAADKPAAALLLTWWLALAALLALGGLGLGIREVLMRRARERRPPPGRVPFLWPFGMALRLLLLLAIVVMLLPFVHMAVMAANLAWANDVRVWSLVAMLVIHAMLLLFIWGFASASGVRVGEMFGLTRDRIGAAIRGGLKGYAIAFPWIFGLLVVIASLAERFGIKPSVETIHELIFLEYKGPVMALTVFLACVMGPIAEEIVFRGVLYSTLRRRCTRGMAMLISGALFAAVHTNLIGFIPITVLGMLLAERYERTGSLLAPAAIHIVHNTLLMGLALTLKEFL